MTNPQTPRALYRLTPQGSRALPWPSEATSLDAATQILPPGFYTTFRTFARKSRVLGLRRHLRRLYAPLAGPAPLSRAALRAVLRAALQAYPAEEARVRLVMVPNDACYALLEPLIPPKPEVYRTGVAALTVDLRRPRPHEKRTDFLRVRAQLRERLQAAGAYEALLAPWGRIREGLTSNFFWIRAGQVGTAKWGVLPGVTRSIVIRLARTLALPLRYYALPVQDIPTLAEAFLTSSSRGIVPIVRIDGQVIGTGRPGPLTQHLRAHYEAYVQQAAESL